MPWKIQRHIIPVFIRNKPILVRKKNKEQYEIIAGERRWRAAQLVGLHEVPVIVKDIENQQALEFGIIENIQRESLNPVELAESYQKLCDEHRLSHDDLSKMIGKSVDFQWCYLDVF